MTNGPIDSNDPEKSTFGRLVSFVDFDAVQWF